MCVKRGAGRKGNEEKGSGEMEGQGWKREEGWVGGCVCGGGGGGDSW